MGRGAAKCPHDPSHECGCAANLGERGSALFLEGGCRQDCPGPHQVVCVQMLGLAEGSFKACPGRVGIPEPCPGEREGKGRLKGPWALLWGLRGAASRTCPALA